MIKTRRSTAFGLKTFDVEACYSMLERFVPSEFEELREDIPESVE